MVVRCCEIWALSCAARSRWSLSLRFSIASNWSACSRDSWNLRRRLRASVVSSWCLSMRCRTTGSRTGPEGYSSSSITCPSTVFFRCCSDFVSSSVAFFSRFSVTSRLRCKNLLSNSPFSTFVLHSAASACHSCFMTSMRLVASSKSTSSWFTLRCRAVFSSCMDPTRPDSFSKCRVKFAWDISICDFRASIRDMFFWSSSARPFRALSRVVTLLEYCSRLLCNCAILALLAEASSSAFRWVSCSSAVLDCNSFFRPSSMFLSCSFKARFSSSILSLAAVAFSRLS
mmetsp:Transcript_12577/g.22854  ORF Transcript_12577/g.22854 Transcript_12577/m.22854 type:complete len:286 (+) Transcript_12577:630-1487(+)